MDGGSCENVTYDLYQCMNFDEIKIKGSGMLLIRWYRKKIGFSNPVTAMRYFLWVNMVID